MFELFMFDASFFVSEIEQLNQIVGLFGKISSKVNWSGSCSIIKSSNYISLMKKTPHILPIFYYLRLRFTIA